MQQNCKISDLKDATAASVIWERKRSLVTRALDLDWSLRPCTTKFVLDSYLFDDASASDEWTPGGRIRKKVLQSVKKRSKKKFSRKRRLKKKPSRQIKRSKKNITVRKLQSLPTKVIFEVPIEIAPRRILPPNPSFPKHSIPFKDDYCLSNGLVVWAKASNDPWLPGRVEWVQKELLDLDSKPKKLDPGPSNAPNVPVRYFGEKCFLKKVSRVDVIQFDTEDTHVKEWLDHSSFAKGDLKFYRDVLRDAIRAVKYVNKGWLNKPLLMEWGEFWCIGEISSLDSTTGFCHIIYKTGFQEKIYIFSRNFHFLVHPLHLFDGVKEENVPANFVGWADKFFDEWPAIVSKSAKGLSAMQKQVPRAIHRMFCSSGRVIVLDPRIPYYDKPSSSKSQHIFKIVTGIDEKDLIAETCYKLCETYWSKKVVRAKNFVSLYERRHRPVTGFTYLESPTGEALVASIWSIWELNAWEKGLMVKFFLTKSRNQANVSQRRKSNGSMVVAHLLDLSFSRYDINLVVVCCSQRGNAEVFWKSRGFKKITRVMLKNISRIPMRELNPFSDTVLVAITREEFCQKYLSKDPSAMAHVFRKWSPKHRNRTRNVSFTNEGKIVRKMLNLPKY